MWLASSNTAHPSEKWPINSEFVRERTEENGSSLFFGFSADLVRQATLYRSIHRACRDKNLSCEYPISSLYYTGVAFPGQEVKIFDSHGKEVKTGEIGEIVIRGPNVMQGYYRNETATKDTLKNGWLHTGIRSSPLAIHPTRNHSQ